MSNGFECVWGQVMLPYAAGITAAPPVVQLKVQVIDTGEVIDGQLQPGIGGWYFPLVGEQVMCIVPRGDMAPGNALIIPNPTGTETSRDTFLKWANRLMVAILAWAPVPNDGGAALKTALTTFNTAYPVPDTLASAVIVDNAP